jgi:hypothetical protein
MRAAIFMKGDDKRIEIDAAKKPVQIYRYQASMIFRAFKSVSYFSWLLPLLKVNNINNNYEENLNLSS